MSKKNICLGIFFSIGLVAPSVLAQTNNSLGGVIQPASLREPYGINDTSILNSQTFPTRHRRLSDQTGIGSSFIQTTSPTSESSPALRPTSIPIPPVTSQLTKRPVSMYGNVEKTPALGTQTYSFDLGAGQIREKSPALTGLRARNFASIEASINEDMMIKKPLTVTEPLQHLNMHRTGGNDVIQY